jgi:acyl-CoA thioesterase I
MRKPILAVASTLLLAACGPRSRTQPPANDASPPSGQADMGGDGPTSPLGSSVKIAQPNRIVSRGRPITSSEGNSSNVDGTPQPITTLNDGFFSIGDGFTAAVSSGQPAWVAIDVGAGPSRLLLTWLSFGQADAPEQAPVDYHIDVSADGQSWTTIATVTANATNARESTFDFGGKSHVRLVLDRADASGAVHLVEVEAYDVSAGADDTWVLLGDSVAASVSRYASPDFATQVTAQKPTFTPLLISQAIGGTQTTYGLDHIDDWIARYPDMRNWAVQWGTNDAGCDTTGEGVPGYIARLKTIVDKLKAAGKRVLIPHIPWNEYCPGQATDLKPYNDAIDQLIQQENLIAGPDLYAWFAAHQGDLGPDHVHPDEAGVVDLNRLWAEAATSLYP